MRTVIMVAIAMGCGGRVGLEFDESPAADAAIAVDSATPATCGASVRTESTQPSGRCSTTGLRCRYEVRYTCPDGTPRGSTEVDCQCNGIWTCQRVGGGFSLRPCDEPPPSTDSGIVVDTGPPRSCAECQSTRCGAEQMACQADMAKLKGCNDLIMCINACYDAACANKCLADSRSAEGKALLACVTDKCAEACAG